MNEPSRFRGFCIGFRAEGSEGQHEAFILRAWKQINRCVCVYIDISVYLDFFSCGYCKGILLSRNTKTRIVMCTW